MKKKANNVAIIIPSYNYGLYLGELLDSIFDQTTTPQKCIVVDDGSIDGTKEIVSRYPNVEYLFQTNQGPSKARNLGILSCKEEWVVLPDADDVLMPDAIQSLYKCTFKINTDVNVIFAQCQYFYENDNNEIQKTKLLPTWEDIEPWIEKKIDSDLFLLSNKVNERILRSNIIPQCTALVRRSIYDKCGYWDETIRSVEDREFWLRIASTEKIVFLKKRLAKVRRHTNNLSNNKNWVQNRINILKLLRKTICAKWADKYLRQLAQSQYAITSYLLAQKFADQKNYRLACKYLWSSILHDWRSMKAWMKLIIYYTYTLFGKA